MPMQPLSPAFPAAHNKAGSPMGGLSQLDFVAIMAMQALLQDSLVQHEDVAPLAYRMAARMIAESAVQESPHAHLTV